MFTELNGLTALDYYLRAECRAVMPPFIRVWKNDPGALPIFIPSIAEGEFRVTIKSPGTRLFVSREEISIEEYRCWRLPDVWKLARLRRFKKYTRYDDADVRIQPLLHGSEEGLGVARAVRSAAQWGFGTSMRSLQRTLSYEFTNHTESAKGVASALSIAIVVDLYYDELWPDFESRLSRLSLPFTLIVTTVKTRPLLADRIRASFPDAKIVNYPNRGRDVGRFIQILRDKHLDKFDLVCKVHGKKSATLGPQAVFGDIWRRSMLNDLLGSDRHVKTIVDRFAAEPSVGLIGPARFRLPNEYRHSYVDTWGRGNELITKELAAKLGYPREEFILDFFAGTMFWIRKDLLDLLKPLDLSLDSFPDEEGQTDGTLQHALERLFGALPGLANPKMKTEEATLSTELLP
ncbi:Rhamnan synthesis protein F OS=Afipia felis OX=1035 GN=NCTC12722_01217 PE=4 SV=1 [Afipia felis]